MAIAVSMFGISVGGLLPYLLRRGVPACERFTGVPPRMGMVLSFASSLFTLLPYCVLLLFARYPLWASRLLSIFHQPYYEPFRETAARLSPATDTLQVGALLLLFSLPFVGAGAIFALAFSDRGREGKTYLSVMAGSAAGVAAYLAAMRAGSGPAAILFVAALFSLSAAFAPTAEQTANRTSHLRFLFRGFGTRFPSWFSVCAAILVLFGFLETRYGFAEIRFARGRYEPGMLWSRWDAVSRVAVYPVSGEESTKAWGVSPRYAGPAPADRDGGWQLWYALRDRDIVESCRRSRERSVRTPSGGARGSSWAGRGKGMCASPRAPVVTRSSEPRGRAAEEEFRVHRQVCRMPGRAVVAEGRNFRLGCTTDVLQ
jgi:hypothetical protein